MISATFKSKSALFLNKFNRNKYEALSKIGKVGVDKIKEETPVDTGLLKSDNKFKIYDGRVIFYNNTPYARFIELGTCKMTANSFMRRGIAKTNFLKILIKEFKV